MHLHNPVVEGVWWAKKEKKPCVMTVYNWKRKGLHPRLLAWKWAVKNADRRWYISEFVWNTWEKVRVKGSDRLPVISRIPRGEHPTHKRKGFLFIGRFVPNKGIRVLIEAYSQICPNPETWPLLWGMDRCEKKLQAGKTKKYKGVTLTGFVSETERYHFTREAKWMVTPPPMNLGLTPLEARSVGVPCIATLDGSSRDCRKDALFCKPGCVDSLAKCLQEAIEMSGDMSKNSLIKDGLKDYVRPLDQYAENYLQLLSEIEYKPELKLLTSWGLSCLGILLYHVRIDLWIGWWRVTSYPQEYSAFAKAMAWFSIPTPFWDTILLFLKSVILHSLSERLN